MHRPAARTTQLLVSVRSAAEAAIALRTGVALIDVKEPWRGPLGAADLETIDVIATLLDGRAPLSVALGELDTAVELPHTFAGRVQYAKIGLAGCHTMPDWLERWQAALESLPAGVTPVAVAYADWRTAGAPQPASVLEHGIALGCGAMLLDTYDKTHGPLFNHIEYGEISQLIWQARRHELVSVIAGGLGSTEIAQAQQLGPDYVAVRGAACDTQRTGALDAERVSRLVSLVHAGGAPLSA